MDMVAPLGPMYQAGTLSGNPLAMAAGIAQLKILRDKKSEIYRRLESLSAKLVDGVAAAAKEAGIKLTAQRTGSMFTWFFNPGPITDWTEANNSDVAAFGRFFRKMLDAEIYLPASQFETAFLSTAHSEEDISKTIDAAKQAFRK
jgi:glutamate-1-semialdehyde 2,1-aminomutase